MMVKMWGPAGWRFLHSVAHGFPESPSDFDMNNGSPPGTTESNYKIFFTMVGKTLPCGLCRNSYNEFILENPIRTGSRAELTKWLWEIHNKVNEKLGREYPKSDYDTVFAFYERSRASCSSNSNAKGCTDPMYKKTSRRKVLGYTGLILAISIMIYLFFWVI